MSNINEPDRIWIHVPNRCDICRSGLKHPLSLEESMARAEEVFNNYSSIEDITEQLGNVANLAHPALRTTGL